MWMTMKTMYPKIKKPPKELGSSRERIRTAALHSVNRRPYLKKELCQRLCQKGGEPSAVEAVLEELAEGGLLDDAKAVEAIIYARKNYNVKGRNYICRELNYKGGDPELVGASLLENYSLKEEKANLSRLLKQEAPKLALDDPAKKSRQVKNLIRKMLARGFEPSLVFELLNELLDESLDEELDLE